jgi:ligand-binding sensor domain-containing protein
LADNQIRSIQEDENGTIWFGTSHGVSSYDGQTFKSHPVGKNPASPKADTDLYFNAGTQEGIYRYDGQQLNYVAFPTPNVSPTGNTYAVTSFSKGKNNMLWIGTYAGVWGYNGIGVLLKEADTITHFPKEQGKLTPAPQAVFAIAEDKDGNIWFGDRDTGAWKYDGTQLTPYTIDTQLTSPMIWCIYKDQQDHLLFGMAAGGVYQFNGKSFSRKF